MFSFIKIKFFLSYIFLFFTRYPIFSLSFLIIISLLGIFAPLIAPYNPYVADTRARLMPPGIVSGLYNLQNFDLIKAEGQISQTPRWMQLLELENGNTENKIIKKTSEIIYLSKIAKQAILMATPFSTCSLITDLFTSSANELSISTSLLIGPGCITRTSSLAFFNLSDVRPYFKK